MALVTSSVPTGFSLMKIDSFCAGASARIVSESVLGAGRIPPAPSPSASTGKNAIAETPLMSEAGFPSSFSPSSQEVFQPPSTYFRKSSPPASTTSRPSRCETAWTRLAMKSNAVR